MFDNRYLKTTIFVLIMIMLIGCAPAPTIATETEVPTIAPLLGIVSTMDNPVDKAVMVYVPEGEFLMGSEDEDAWEDEGPEHYVFLDAFWLYQTPVTNDQFAIFVDQTGHQTTAEDRGWGYVFDGDNWWSVSGAYWRAVMGPGSDLSGLGDHPVVHVSWLDANAYCAWAGGRLPTEAEWEKAARGIDGRKYPWGDQNPTCDLANYDGCVDGTSPVGSYPAGASPYGALDMAGNVYEWVADWFTADYYSNSPYDNPTGPATSERRVLRGGSWYDGEGGNLRVSYRVKFDPDYSFFGFNGFRCFRSP